jgi:phosphate-selective porin OprO/OprP
MTLRKILLTGTALGAAAMLASPAFAAGASQAEIDALKAQVEALTQRLDDLQISSGNEIKEIKEKQDAVQVSLDKGKPMIKTGDGLFSMAIRGRAHLDVASYDQSDANAAKSGNALDSGANFRRAELGVEGTFMRDWGYKANFQWGGSGSEANPPIIKDLYVSYNGIKGISLMAGAIQTFMALDDSTSSNDITFIERATASNLATSLGAGDGRISFGGKGSTENFYASLFYTMNTVGTAANTSNEGSAVVGRTAFRFKPMDNTNVHIGVSGTYKMDPNGTVNFSDRPELRVDAGSFINTGLTSNADSAYVFGPEFAASYGPFRVQGEYYYYKIDQAGALPDPDFNAWYAQASWVLTGEKYKYSMEEAAYKGVSPDSPFTLGGGIGAWEIAARYSQADLDYNPGSGVAVANTNVRGGKQDIITVGLNWYPNSNIRFMLEYLDVDIKKLNAAGADAGDEHNAVAARMQFAF